MAQHRDINHTGLTGVSTVSYASNANQTSTANYGGAATTVSRGDHIHLSTGGSGDVATDAIWTTAGKVAVATGAATATEQWPPGHEFDYVQITSAGSPTATTEASSDTIITGSAVAYDGSTVVMVDFYCPDARPADSAGAWMVVSLFEGATQLGRLAWMSLPTTLSATLASQRHPLNGHFRLTPTNASHTYHIKAHVSTGTGYIGAGAGGTGALVPAFMRITKVG